jgi:hypothetical protein
MDFQFQQQNSSFDPKEQSINVNVTTELSALHKK